MFSLLLLDRRWCDSSGRKAVWDVFVFHCLLQMYPAIGRQISADGTNYFNDECMHLGCKHKISDRVMSTRACVISLLKVLD